ncbi:FERM and PDZ domain-containing protein 4-like [Genypterus blacodes]|uniref:FERM and PDZ domain-containing protein 4-like n=1 Tax=Genypterus blacodes TaxID=154954 RepID=UPI003F75FED4
MTNSREGRDCFSNQVSQSSSLEEVHLDAVPPVPRLVEMRRDPVLGFGFVAGSEKPVVVRSVTPGGPSEGNLLPGDEIIMINDEPVSSAPRERVIDLVRSCKESIVLTVVQPYPSPKSAFISAAKKAKLKSNPVKVRFAEEVIINGQVPNSAKDNSLLFMPNVLKVYLENGQTKSFRFDSSTSIKDVILTLQEKLSLKCIEHFSLVLEQRSENSGSRMLLLHEQEMLMKVTQRPGSDKTKCFFRLSFVPRDPVELLRRDAVAFEYLYVQSCNDVVLERFGSELKYDAALRLAALQMYILTVTTKQTQKVSLKYIQKEWGLPLFLPPAVLSSMKEKNIKKALTHILKTNQNLVPPGKKLTALQAKVHYLRYLSELKLYGGREFKSTLVQGEKQTAVTLLVGPRYGISHVINALTNLVALLADFSHVNRIEILTEDETDVRLELHVLDVRPISLIMDSSDAMNLACLTAGYYRLLVDSRRSIFSMAHCNSTAGDETSPDRALEWPYSSSLGDNEEPPHNPGGTHDQGHNCLGNGQRENSSSPFSHEAQPPDRDVGGRRSPLPPSTRLTPQDSPRSAKVSFIFGGDPPLNKAKSLGYKMLVESPDGPDRPPYLHNTQYPPQDRAPFQYSGRPHVYSNICLQSGEEPLLRDLCYADTTDEAEDEDDASCEEDSTGGTPVGDEGGGGNANCGNQGLATAASQATFLTLSCSTDDIIDLTSLPPPEGDEAADNDEDDTLFETLNLAIAAPPPGFRDSSDEDVAPDARPQNMHDNDSDIPVSLIDAVLTQEEGEGSRGAEEESLDNTVMNTLQALEALSVSEQRRRRPQPSTHNPGVFTSQGFSLESSSDSGNETNSSEMTEICELAASHRLSESHLRLLVATREGYQPLLEEKTEFPVSPSTGTIQRRCSPSRLLQPPPVPPRPSPQFDPLAIGPDRLELRPQTNLSATLVRPNSTTPGGKHHKKSADSNGKYNTFSTRDAHRSGRSMSHVVKELRTSFCERGAGQSRQSAFLRESFIAEGFGASNYPQNHNRSPEPPSSTSDRLLEVHNSGECNSDNGASAVEPDEHLAVASLVSPTKKPRLGGSDQGSDAQPDHQMISRQQSVARLCEYHLAKRISNLQGEAQSSLQSSVCSSLDAGGGSMNGSACATSTDSPLGQGPPESKHHQVQRHPLSSSSSSLLRVLNCEDTKPGNSRSIPGQTAQGRDLRQYADPTLLRKMLPNIHSTAGGAEPVRPSSATLPKHKDASGASTKRLHNDLNARQQACFKGLNQMEGSDAYKQLINYLTISQMHQGGKLHGAGMGGAVKKDSRRYITSNPQLMEMLKRGNTIARCPCTPSSSSSPFLNPNLANTSAGTMQLANQNPRTYHSATLPAKLKRSPVMLAEKSSVSTGFRSATIDKGSSFPSADGGRDQGLFLSLGEGCVSQHGGFNTGRNHDGMGATHRPPPRSRSQPGGHIDDWVKSEQSRVKHAVCLSPPSHPNDSLRFSTAPTATGQRPEPNTVSPRRGDPSGFMSQSSVTTRLSPTTNLQSLLPPPPLPPALSLSVQTNKSSSNSSTLPKQDSILSAQTRQNQNHIQAITQTLVPPDHFSNTLQRGRELKRSCSSVTASSASVEVLFEKPTRSRSQQPLLPSVAQQSDTKAQRRPTRKRLSKSYSQGSVSSQTCWSASSRADGRRASVVFPLQKDSKHIKGSQKLDPNAWRCNGPFSYCFFKRKSEGEEDETELEKSGRSHGGNAPDSGGGTALAVLPCGPGADTSDEQLFREVLNNMSLSDQLARINVLKDRMYGFPAGFTDVRRDASELIALVRSSVGRCDRGVQMPHLQDVSQFKQLLSVESKELGRACRRMAQAHGSPEEMLLAVTCSFQVLCCLCEACMCLVQGLGPSASHQQREVVAKVDEVVMNYICLLKAAEAATVGAPGEHSVKALVRHSSTMSAIANALTRSLKTLLSK